MKVVRYLDGRDYLLDDGSTFAMPIESELVLAGLKDEFKVLKYEIVDGVWGARNTAIKLPEARAALIGKCRTSTSNVILAQYPTWKQININELQGYTEQDKVDMWAYINAKRGWCDTQEATINATTIYSALAEINTDCPTE